MDPSLENQNFKYEIFSNNTDSIQVANNNNEDKKNGLFQIKQKPNSQQSDMWKRFGEIPISNFVDKCKQSIPVFFKTRSSNCFNRLSTFVYIVIVFVVLILLTLSIVSQKQKYNILNKFKNQCTNKECFLAGSNIVRNQNKSVAICDNFYKFACGAFYTPYQNRHIKEPPTSQAVNTLYSVSGIENIRHHFSHYRGESYHPFDRPMIEHLNEANVYSMINALKTIYSHKTQPVYSAKYKLATYYQSCTFIKWRNFMGAKPLIKKLASIVGGIWLFDKNATNNTGAGGLNATLNWPNIIFSLLHINLTFNDRISTFDLMKDLQNNFFLGFVSDFYLKKVKNNKYQIHMLPDRRALSKMSNFSKNYYVKNLMQILIKESNIDIYNKEIQNRLQIFADDVQYFTNKMYQAFYKHSNSQSENIKLGDLSNNEINWPNYFKSFFSDNEVIFDNNYVVSIEHKEYIKNIPQMFTDIRKEKGELIFKRIIHNFIIWSIFDGYSTFLSYEYYMFENKYYFEDLVSVELECFFTINNIFDTIMNSIYVEYHLHEETEKEIDSMTKALKESMSDHVNRLAWMDKTTKKNVHTRIDNMKILHKIPEIIKDETKLNLAFNSFKVTRRFLDNLFEIIRYQKAQYNRLLTGMVETTEENWNARDIMIYDSHIGIFLDNDELFVPPGVLQLPVYHHNLPAGINFGGLGSLIGSAMGILIGSKEKIWSKNETSVSLWSSYTSENYENKCNCMKEKVKSNIQQYFQSFIWRKYYNRQLYSITKTLIDETSGLDIARSALNTWIDKYADTKSTKSLPGLEYTSKELFYISFAQTYCHDMERWDEFLNTVYFGNKPPFEKLVNLIVSEIPDFAKTFKCPPNSKMNPHARCQAMI